jgi:hypothetical protein
MFQPSPSGYFQVHIHKYIKEKLKYLYDFSYISTGNSNLMFILHCQYIMLHKIV